MTASSRWQALGTSAEVFVTDESELATARELVERELRAIEVSCSRLRPDSDLARVNAAPGRWVDVSRVFLETVNTALAAAQTTEGDVNPTLGRALRVAGYDRDLAELPALRTGRVRFVPAPGWRLVQVDSGRPAVRVPRGVELELGATARALAADRAARACALALRGGALVNVGGDLAVGGPAPSGGWPVHVTASHQASFDAPGQTVSIASGGLATSSAGAPGFAAGAATDGAENARGNGPSAGEFWRTVSVAAASCVAASIASSASIARGAAALAWLDSLRLPARLVGPDGMVARVADWPADAPA
jgi:thiamine biosynthesis lipoprotein